MGTDEQATISSLQENLDDRRFELWEQNLRFLIDWVKSLLAEREKLQDRIKSQKQQLLRFNRGNMPNDSFCVFCGHPLCISGCMNKNCSGGR